MYTEESLVQPYRHTTRDYMNSFYERLYSKKGTKDEDILATTRARVYEDVPSAEIRERKILNLSTSMKNT